MMQVFTPLSTQHIHSAALFARLSSEAEIEYASNRLSWDSHRHELAFRAHQAYVSATILMLGAYLESAIQELFIECGNEKPRFTLDDACRRALADHWKGLRAKSTLVKYTEALRLCGKPSFEPSDVYDRAALLLSVRNRLYHYEPRWVAGLTIPKGESEEYLVKQLLGQERLGRNPFMQDARADWPHCILSHSIAGWAVKTTVEFTEDFRTRIGATYESCAFWGKIRADYL